MTSSVAKCNFQKLIILTILQLIINNVELLISDTFRQSKGSVRQSSCPQLRLSHLPPKRVGTTESRPAFTEAVSPKRAVIIRFYSNLT